MNTQIIYSTLTGHSKKIAHYISDKTGISSCHLKDISKSITCDLLFLIGGIYGGESSGDMLNFAKSLDASQVKKVVLLTSSTKNSPQGNLRKTLADNGVCVAKEEYLCQGSFLFCAMGHPNQEETEKAYLFVKEQLETALHNNK